jgi:hypothetical protein
MASKMIRGAPTEVRGNNYIFSGVAGSEKSWHGLLGIFAVSFEQLAKLLAKLLELRRNRVLTVGLKKVIGIILLMVIFGLVELPEGFERCHHRLSECLRVIDFFDACLGFTLLIVIGV